MSDRNADVPLGEDTGFDFAPNMPDVTKRQPHRAFMVGPYFAMLVKNPPCVAEGAGASAFIKYLHVLVVTKAVSDPNAPRPIVPIYFVTLEKGLAPEPMLCAFNRHGVHMNFGAGSLLTDEDKFVENALNIVRREFGISEGAQELRGMGKHGTNTVLERLRFIVPILFAVAPALYAWNRNESVGIGVLVLLASYGAFMVCAWIQSRRVSEIDLTFSVFRTDLERRRLFLQVVMPSIVGWPLAIYLS